MSRITLFADVLLPLPIRGTFTYRVPFAMNDFIEEGQRVAVQFGKKKIYAGLVKKLHEKVPGYTPKYILHILDEQPLVNAVQFRFWEWLSAYYMSTQGEVMNVALPSAFKLASESKVLLSPDFRPDFDLLDEYEYKITEALLAKKRLTVDEIGKTIGFQNVLPFLKKMIEKKMITMEEELEGGYRQKKEKYIRLSPAFRDEEAIRTTMDELGKRAHKQLELVMAFIALTNYRHEDGAELKKSLLLHKADAGPSALKALVDKGVFEEYEKIVSRFEDADSSKENPRVKLTSPQQEAFQLIRQKFGDHRVVLLHGVTSGGKTELYIKLIQETLDKGQQVLYLLPEIALTTQIITRLRKYFGNQVGIYHSRYSRDERAEVWNNIAGLEKAEGTSPFRIILGPRSSVFLPFTNLGLIIVDEEHDPSYKQYDPAPRYHARDAAIYLSTLHNAKVLLGSATPAVESYYNALHGKYGLVELSERYGGMKLPGIEVVDMRVEHRRHLLKSHFTSVLMKEMKNALDEKKQIILFQNRRGFSLRIECGQCHWIPMCKNCDVTLTYHKQSDLLKCHYCGYSTHVPASCGQCGSTDLKMQGFGTEKVEEELAFYLPEAHISRMDLDSTRSKKAYHRIINDFEERRTDILVGTQMVTKGLDFDHVQVVGILSADNMLSFPDFRAHERSYQLMAQVSGRSGRKFKQGKVIIQTWQPGHPIIDAVVNHDYLSMYNLQVLERQQFKYPPFYRLIIIRLKHRKANVLHEAAEVFAIQLRKKFGTRVMGPEYPLVGRVRNYFIQHIIIKSPRNENTQKVKEGIYSVFERFRTKAGFKSVVVQFDVDPQ